MDSEIDNKIDSKQDIKIPSKHNNEITAAI